MWANLISKYFPLQFHLLSRQQCEKPLWCFPRLRDRRQEELTSRLFSKSSAQQQPFRSCCGEKEQGGLECVSPCEGPDVISVCVRGWNAEVSPVWKMCLLMATFKWPWPKRSCQHFMSPAWEWKHEVNGWQLPCWWKLCVYLGMAGNHCTHQQHYFYGDHVTACDKSASDSLTTKAGSYRIQAFT